MLESLRRQVVKHWLRRHVAATDRVRAVVLDDVVSIAAILDRLFEARELDTLSREVFPGLARPACALDVGANIGTHACAFAAHFDRVVAFEPIPRVAAILRINAMGRPIEVVEKGLSSARDSLHFEINERSLDCSRVTDRPTGVTIEVETLDRLAEPLALENVRFIKIDVEGHEADVLAGGRALLREQRPVIALEGFYRAYPEKAARVRALLNEFGYGHFYRFVPSRCAAFDRKYGARRRLLPKPLRPTFPLTLDPIDHIADEDYNLVIAAAVPLRRVAP